MKFQGGDNSAVSGSILEMLVHGNSCPALSVPFYGGGV